LRDDCPAFPWRNTQYNLKIHSIFPRIRCIADAPFPNLAFFTHFQIQNSLFLSIIFGASGWRGRALRITVLHRRGKVLLLTPSIALCRKGPRSCSWGSGCVGYWRAVLCFRRKRQLIGNLDYRVDILRLSSKVAGYRFLRRAGRGRCLLTWSAALPPRRWFCELGQNAVLGLLPARASRRKWSLFIRGVVHVVAGNFLEVGFESCG
jgi:hypothetical protein